MKWENAHLNLSEKGGTPLSMKDPKAILKSSVSACILSTVQMRSKVMDERGIRSQQAVLQIETIYKQTVSDSSVTTLPLPHSVSTIILEVK